MWINVYGVLAMYNVCICNSLCLLLLSLNQVADSPANCSGIRPKDVIVKCDGKVVRSTLEVCSILACVMLSSHDNDSLFSQVYQDCYLCSLGLLWLIRWMPRCLASSSLENIFISYWLSSSLGNTFMSFWLLCFEMTNILLLV